MHDVKSWLVGVMNDNGFNLQEKSSGFWSQTWEKATNIQGVGGIMFDIPSKTTLHVHYLEGDIYGICASEPVTVGFNGVPPELGINGEFSYMKLEFTKDMHIHALETDMTNSVIGDLLRGGHTF